MAENAEPKVVPVKNGWHAGNVPLNITVWGATPDEARERFEAAVRKAAELRKRSKDWGKTPVEVG